MDVKKIYPDPSSDGLPLKRDIYTIFFPRIIYYILLFLSSILYFFYIELAHDYIEYISLFYRLQEFEFIEIFYERFEPLFITLAWLLVRIAGPEQIYYLIAIFILIVKYFIWNKFSDPKNILYFILVYFPIFSFILDANQIRAGLASIFLFYIILASPSVRTIIIFAIIAMLLHYSGVICLFALMRTKSLKKILITAIVAFISVFILSYSGSLNFLIFNTYLLSTDRENKTLFSIISVSYLFIAFLVVSNWRNLHGTRRAGAIYILVGITFYYLPIPAITSHRIAEMSLIGIMPFLATFNKKTILDIALLLPIGVIVIYYSVFLLGRTGLL